MGDPRDLFDLTGFVAVVTGASSGLGRQAASALRRAGAEVVGVARREAALKDWQAGMGQGTAFVAADIADRDHIPDIAASVSSFFGAPNIVVHAAGLNPRKPAEALTGEDWDATLAINLAAPFFLTRALIGPMKEQGWGRIVNFASLQTTRAFPAGLAYGSTKAGIAQMTRAMAEEWSPHGITANAIGPGFFPTELTQAVFDDPERAARNAAQTCIGRNGELSDMDGPLLFLCSQASAYVTGQVLMVDGGFTAK